MVKLGKYGRSVSIIGVGCTDFMYTLENEQTKGLTEGELFSYAAEEAMKDAGIKAKDLDFYVHGCALPDVGMGYITPNAQVTNWFGMRGKASFHHSEACCTGYLGVDLAANMVASGKYDFVLSGCVEMADSLPILGKPAHLRKKMTNEEFIGGVLPKVYDRCYSGFYESAQSEVFDDVSAEYCRKYGLTDEQMDDVLCMMAISSRRGAVNSPKGIQKQSYEELAKQFGFNDVMEFMKSQYNPKMSEYLRVSDFETRCEGAAAVIICPTELASKFSQTPIEILGTGNCLLEGSQPHLERRGTAEAARQVYELTGLNPSDIDLLYANDFIIASQLLAAEELGYLPRGEGWKAFLNGETAFDGDKPVNPNGGRCHFGHAYGASGTADFYDAVMQMRGQAGAHQVKKLPKHTMLRGFGGGQNLTATILKTVE